MPVCRDITSWWRNASVKIEASCRRGVMQGAAWSNECLHLKLNFQLNIQIAGLPGTLQTPKKRKTFRRAWARGQINRNRLAIDDFLWGKRLSISIAAQHHTPKQEATLVKRRPTPAKRSICHSCCYIYLGSFTKTFDTSPGKSTIKTNRG